MLSNAQWEEEQQLCEGCFTFAADRRQMQPYSIVSKNKALRAVSAKITVTYIFFSDLLFEILGALVNKE